MRERSGQFSKRKQATTVYVIIRKMIIVLKEETDEDNAK